MKLKNKISGEIKEFALFDGNELQGGATLESLTKEWEDYEEPKVLCFINWFGEVSELLGHISDREIEKLKDTGNYFETREEAEKALEKLKAFANLRKRGFKFTGWDRHPDYPGDYRITASDEWTCDDKDLDLLFGGEE